MFWGAGSGKSFIESSGQRGRNVLPGADPISSHFFNKFMAFIYFFWPLRLLSTGKSLTHIYNTSSVLQGGVVCKRSLKQYIPLSRCCNIGLFNSKHSTEWQLPALARFSAWNYLAVPNLPLQSTSNTRGELSIAFKESVPPKYQAPDWPSLGVHCYTWSRCSLPPSSPQQPELCSSFLWGLKLTPSRPGKDHQIIGWKGP